MMDPREQVAVQEIVLERVKLGLEHRVGATVLESMRPEVIIDQLSGEMVYRLRAHVLAEKLPPVEVSDQKSVTFESPASPFQHWKQKHARTWWLAWFVGRWPVRQEATTKTVRMTVNLTKYRSYPEANYAIPDGFGAPVLIHTLSTRYNEGVDW